MCVCSDTCRINSSSAQSKYSSIFEMLMVCLMHCDACLYGVFMHAESERLQQDLLKVEQLEGKVTTELQTLRDQLKLMTQELHTYRDLVALRAAGEERKKVRNTSYTLSSSISLITSSVHSEILISARNLWIKT